MTPIRPATRLPAVNAPHRHAARTGGPRPFAAIFAVPPKLAPPQSLGTAEPGRRTGASAGAEEGAGARQPVAAARRGSGDSEAERAPFTPDAIDALDTTARRTALLAPPQLIAPATPTTEPTTAVAARSVASLEELLPQLVKRIAWAGDRRKASLQLELADASPHAGSTVTVHAEEGRVRVEVDGHDADALRERVLARLARRGISVER